jgi:hypothetical protein
MFGFLNNVVESVAPAAAKIGEALFSAPESASESESYAVPGVAPDYGALASYAEDEESVDISAIETDDRWDLLDGVFQGEDVTGFRNISEMVDGVIEGAEGAPIGRLQIIDHAAPGQQEIGDQDLTSAMFEETEENAEVLADMARLRDQFGADGSIELKGCSVAAGDEGEQLLRDMARFFNVPTKGARRIQTPLIPGLEGPTMTCYPPEYDEESGKTYQTCTESTDTTDSLWESAADFFGV